MSCISRTHWLGPRAPPCSSKPSALWGKVNERVLDCLHARNPLLVLLLAGHGAAPAGTRLRNCAGGVALLLDHPVAACVRARLAARRSTRRDELPGWHACLTEVQSGQRKDEAALGFRRGGAHNWNRACAQAKSFPWHLRARH